MVTISIRARLKNKIFERLNCDLKSSNVKTSGLLYMNITRVCITGYGYLHQGHWGWVEGNTWDKAPQQTLSQT